MLTHKTLLVATALSLLSACASMSGPVTVADTIGRNPQLSTLNGLVQKAGLADMLKGSGPYTVFAPTNDAFNAVPAKTMDELGKDPAKLKALLSYHVLPVKVLSSEVKNGNAKTAHGGNVALSKAGDFVTVEDAMVQTANISATNGVVHTVDRVLMPPASR